MIFSMTGFASKSASLILADGSKIDVSLSLKSLNSRFFETTCKLPYSLNQFEVEFIQLLKHHLYRGHIFLTIHLNNASLLKGTIEPSLPAVANYLAAIEIIKEKFGIQSSVTMSDLLSLPDIFYTTERGIDDASKKMIFEIIATLTQELKKSQQIEGAVLKKDLLGRIAVITEEIEKIEQAAAHNMEQQKTKILERIKELASSIEQQPDAHRATLYALLDKIDIHEEIVRFKIHLHKFISILESPKDEKGKLIDFTLQELARENNTISAKCSDARISTLSITIKVELEKAREQAQNIV